MLVSDCQVNPEVHSGGMQEESVPKRMRRKGKRGNFYTSFRDPALKGADGRSKLIEVSLGTNDEVLAQRLLGEMDARRADGGGDPTLLNKKFSFIAQKFIKEVVPSYSKTTQVSIKSRIKADLIPFFGEMRINDIGERQVIDYKFKREEIKRNAVSIQVELSNLKSIISGVRPGWKLPCGKKPQMRFLYKTDPIDVYFNSEAEFQAILGRCPDELKPIILVARKTGLRRANVLGMKWPWVNMIQRKITIPGACFKNGKVHVVKMNKTAHGVFRDLRMEGDLVFPPTGKYKDLAWATWIHYVCESFKEACSAEGRRDFTFHGLRHDFCSQLVMAGVPLYTVSKLAGHSSIKITERYAHLAPDILTDAIHLLDVPPVASELERKMEVID